VVKGAGRAVMGAALNSELKRVEDYIPYFHTMSYLENRFQECGADNEYLKRSAGYANLERFLSHRREWHRCEGSIPRGYLDALGVDLHVLEFTVELDQELYDRVIELPVPVSTYGVRVPNQPAQTKILAGTMDIERAVEFLLNISDRYDMKYFINVPGLKYIEISRQDGIREIRYRPEINVTLSSVDFSTRGNGYYSLV
jgi:hypothetical protein